METYHRNERRNRKGSVGRLLKATEDLVDQAIDEGEDSISHETYNTAKSLEARLSNLQSEITTDTVSTTKDPVEAKKEQSAAARTLSQLDEGMAKLHEIMGDYLSFVESVDSVREGRGSPSLLEDDDSRIQNSIPDNQRIRIPEEERLAPRHD